jgi:hypothetical protein
VAWLAALAATLLAAAPASAALVVDRTWTGGNAHLAASFVAYTSGTGTTTINVTGLAPNSTWTPTYAAGGCSKVGKTISHLAPLHLDATGAASRVSGMGTWPTSHAWASTWSYGHFALHLISGSTRYCIVMRFVHATRVQVAGTGIDLPVIAGGRAVKCNVAMYLTLANQPQERGATFIYAHARKGMFLPLLTASKVRNGASLIGRRVYVYTSDNKRWEYRITRVRRHLTSIQGALEVTARQLWLQTSEGPYSTSTKLVVIAVPVGSPVTVSRAIAAPTPHPLACR